jgi:hypothetical protein
MELAGLEPATSWVYLAFPQQRLDGAHDAEMSADLDAIADLERLLVVEMAGRHHLVATPKLIAVIDPSHSRPGRYARGAPASASLLERVSQVHGRGGIWTDICDRVPLQRGAPALIYLRSRARVPSLP